MGHVAEAAVSRNALFGWPRMEASSPSLARRPSSYDGYVPSLFSLVSRI